MTSSRRRWRPFELAWTRRKQTREPEGNIETFPQKKTINVKTRETIMRLVAEVGKEQKAAASCQEQVRKIKLVFAFIPEGRTLE